MWGKNSSEMIRDDKNNRYFQFEPHLVSLGIWKALKVSTITKKTVCNILLELLDLHMNGTPPWHNVFAMS